MKDDVEESKKLDPVIVFETLLRLKKIILG